MTMNESSGVNIQKLFSGIGIWESKSGERAPNKPLLRKNWGRFISFCHP